MIMLHNDIPFHSFEWIDMMILGCFGRVCSHTRSSARFDWAAVTAATVGDRKTCGLFGASRTLGVLGSCPQLGRFLQ